MSTHRNLALLLPLVVLAFLAWMTCSGTMDVGAPGPTVTGALAPNRAGTESAPTLLAPESDGGADGAAQPGAERAPGLSVHGKVLDELRREPVAGCEARLWTPAGIAATVTTGADGRFAFALPDAPDSDEALEAWVQVAPPAGWTIREEPVDIPPGAETPVELVFHAVRDAERSPLHLTVVDAASGEPVPHYAVRFYSSEGLSEVATSDAAGAIDTEIAYAAGEVFYTEIDLGVADRSPHQHRFAHDGRASEGERRPLAVHIGATYLISVELPEAASPDRFFARVVPEAFAHLGADRFGHTAPLRGGDPLWARFGPFPHHWFITDSRTGPYRLEIHDRHMRWFGGAPVLTVEGRHPGVVRIELVPLATLSGRVFEPSGAPVDGAHVRLDPALAESDAWALAWQMTKINGAFLFKGIAPGTYVLRARTRARGFGEAQLVFDGERDVTRDIVLVPVPTGRVSGRVVSRTGTYVGRPWLFLEPRDEALAGMRLRTMLRLVDEGAGPIEGKFDFGELPIGEYELTIGGAERIFEPEMIVITPPAEQLLFTCLDDVTVADLAFDARDARTGAAPSELYLRYRLGDEIAELGLEGEDPFGPTVREDQPLAWWLLAEGYRPAHGDLSAFHLELGEPWSGAKVARISLAPGWGRIVRVEDESGAGLAGAAVFLDGEQVAETGTDGCVVVGAEEAPTTWTATHGTLVELTSTESEWEIRLVLGAGG